MKTIICISDLHIGVRKKESNYTQRMFGKISESYPGIPILITGDLTNSATLRQFRKARRLLDNLAQTNPILAVPGNHDYAWKGSIPKPTGRQLWAEYLGSPLGWQRKPVPWMGVNNEPKGIEGLGVWKDGPLVYFGIDSGINKNKEISARGFISPPVADALFSSLKKYAGKTRIVFLHHHPFNKRFFTRLHGSRMLLETLENNCELLLFGHKHKYGIWWKSRGVPLIVSSHKSTKALSGDCLMVTIIDIHKPGTTDVSFCHRLEAF
jgi:predicted phosphodiesterase